MHQVSVGSRIDCTAGKRLFIICRILAPFSRFVAVVCSYAEVGNLLALANAAENPGGVSIVGFKTVPRRVTAFIN